MSTKKFQYWPSNGQLGSTKFTIPTTAEDWPDGDALVGNFVYSEGELVDFIDIKGLTPNTSKSTTIPYDYVNIELPFAEDAMTINRGPRNKHLIIKFNGEEVEEGGSVIVTLKYKGCKTVDEVFAVDPDYLTTDIVDGVWSEGLGDLTDGENMFVFCTNLTSFSSDLSSLTNGEGMFYNCAALTSFNSDLSSLTNGEGMFAYTNLTSFNSDLSSLTNGDAMFDYTNLTSFNSDLSSLEHGSFMFEYCKLDTPSVQNIADTINTAPSSNIPLHIGIGNSTPNKEEEAAFNKMTSKGWVVFVGGNGAVGGPPWTPTSLTPIDGEEQQTPIPFWAKLVPSDEQNAQYVDEQGNFYNILGGNYIYGDDLSNYGMFVSEEDAAANMRLTKIEKLQYFV